MTLIYLIIAALSIWINWYIANQFYEIAKVKGFHDSKYLWICFWLSLVGYLLVIALPDHGNAYQTMSDELPDL